MIFELKIHPRVAKETKRLPKDIKRQLFKKLRTIRDDPFREAERIKGYTKYSKLRIGSYRAIIEIRESTHEILLLSVGHRSTVYETLERFLD